MLNTRVIAIYVL